MHLYFAESMLTQWSFAIILYRAIVIANRRVACGRASHMMPV